MIRVSMYIYILCQSFINVKLELRRGIEGMTFY